MRKFVQSLPSWAKFSASKGTGQLSKSVLLCLIFQSAFGAETASTKSSQEKLSGWGTDPVRSLNDLTTQYQQRITGSNLAEFQQVNSQYPQADISLQVYARLKWLQTAVRCASDFASGISPQMEPSELLHRAQDAFATPLDSHELDKSEVKLTERFYEACTAACEQQSIAIELSSSSQDTSNRLRLAEYILVQKLVSKPDRSWTQLDLMALPDWIKNNSDVCAGLEKFALSAARPATAYCFYSSGDQYRAKPLSISAYIFQHSATISLVKGREAAVDCLTLAAERATEAADIINTRLRLAELLSEMKRNDSAAVTVLDLMKALPADGKFSKWTVVYFKYLYSSGDDLKVLKEINDWQGDSRCSSCQPELLFIHWASAKRADKAESYNRKSWIAGN
jgi:hypothetical protein